MNKKTSKPMRFQQRDSRIIAAIHKYDGVLARRHIQAMFWPHASPQAMERRLSLLRSNDFLDWPSQEHRRVHAIPEPVVWLGWRGVMQLASEMNIDVNPPESDGENQLRKFSRRLRVVGIRWQREPRWSQLAHDISVIDFRLAIEKAVANWPSLELESWLPEGEFLTDTDRITFSFKDRRGKKVKKRRGVRPDSFFVLQDHLRLINGAPARARFLLEFDNSTHPLDRFGKEKALAGLAYIRSRAYKQRFGYNSGRWLVVCVSPARLENLKIQTEKVLGKGAVNFNFTTLEQALGGDVLSAPIWARGNSKEREPLIRNISGRGG
jgi:hypothetical protein